MKAYTLEAITLEEIAHEDPMKLRFSYIPDSDDAESFVSRLDLSESYLEPGCSVAVHVTAVDGGFEAVKNYGLYHVNVDGEVVRGKRGGI